MARRPSSGPTSPRSYGARTEAAYDEGYERGVHDHDATVILPVLLRLHEGAGLLRHEPGARVIAQFVLAPRNDARGPAGLAGLAGGREEPTHLARTPAEVHPAGRRDPRHRRYKGREPHTYDLRGKRFEHPPERGSAVRT